MDNSNCTRDGASHVYKLARIVEYRPNQPHASLADARAAALLLNAIRRAHGSALLTHASVYVNGEFSHIEALEPSPSRP